MTLPKAFIKGASIKKTPIITMLDVKT